MYFTTRSQLTHHDFEFIAETLGKSTRERSAILELAIDPTSITELLHQEKLFERSMTIPPVFLSISPQLFFYIFIYRALDQKRLADDDVVDYVAGVCVEFRSSSSLWHFSSAGEKTVYAVDLLNLLSAIDKHQQYYLRRYIGNVTLFLTGFFPDFIAHRNNHKGAPPMQYYERIGKSQYETAANDSMRFDAEAAPVLNILAERFGEIRTAMNVYAKAYFKAKGRPHSIDSTERHGSRRGDSHGERSIDV